MEVPEERRNIFLTAEQLNLLAGEKDIAWKLPAFRTKLSACGLSPLKPTTIDIIQKQFPSESTLSLPGNDEPRNTIPKILTSMRLAPGKLLFINIPTAVLASTDSGGNGAVS